MGTVRVGGGGGFCVVFPSSMKFLITMFSTFALDVFSDTKLPCVLTRFTFYDRLMVAMLTPVCIVVVVVSGGIAWAYCHRKRRKRMKIVDFSFAKRRGSEKSVVVRGLWSAAPIALFLIDLTYPSVTKTLCSFFVCRDLGPAGWWLEEDYSVQPVNILQNT